MATEPGRFGDDLRNARRYFVGNQRRPEMQLSGKVALVTDSTSGIGLGIARALAGAAASVMQPSRNALLMAASPLSPGRSLLPPTLHQNTASAP